MRPEVGDDALTLVEVDRRPFVVMIADVPDETDRGLRQRQEPARHRRHRHAGAGVGVQHALHFGPRLVDRAVDHVAGFVDAVVGVGLPDDVALYVDLDQARGGDLLVDHAVEVDEEMILRARDARRDVIVDQVGHAVLVDQAIAGGEIDACLPFFRRDLCADRLEVGRVIHGSSSCLFVGPHLSSLRACESPGHPDRFSAPVAAEPGGPAFRRVD